MNGKFQLILILFLYIVIFVHVHFLITTREGELVKIHVVNAKVRKKLVEYILILTHVNAHYTGIYAYCQFFLHMHTV